VATFRRHAEILDVLPDQGLVLLNIQSDRGDAWVVEIAGGTGG
jgi:hypothetical protein